LESRKVEALRARVVFDSRGDKTVEVEVRVDGFTARAAAPSGKSRGKREVRPFAEGGPEGSVRALREASGKIVGATLENPLGIDVLLKEVDGTEDFSRIGGNAALATSVAAAIAYAGSGGESLYRSLSRYLGADPGIPLPLSNVLGGGAHAGSGAPEFQEYLLIPVGARDAMEAIETNVLAYRKLGKLLSQEVRGYPLGRGDEGGYAPPIGNRKALELVARAAEETSDETGVKVAIGLDVAGSNVFDPKSGKYALRSDGLYLTGEEMVSYLGELVDEFGIVYLEDPFSEDAPDLFAELQRSVPKTFVCGDDLVVTRPDLISSAIEAGSIRAAIIKPNQVGLLSVAAESAKVCHEHRALPVASHRSGETTDAYLSHFAVGTWCRLIKCGLIGGERMAKLNELLRIGEEIGSKRLRRLSV
jgi:enolase